MISKKVFEDLRALESLDLSYNEINYIDKNAFLHLVSLKELNLAGNKLKILRSRWVIPLESLV